jgi:hypothetical protein
VRWTGHVESLRGNDTRMQHSGRKITKEENTRETKAYMER